MAHISAKATGAIATLSATAAFLGFGANGCKSVEALAFSGLSGGGESVARIYPEQEDLAARLIQDPTERKQFLSFAKTLRPEVGLTKRELGMSLEDFRPIEERIQMAVLARDPLQVVQEIKEKKYGVHTTGVAAPVPDPKYRTLSQFAKADPEGFAKTKAEYDNFKKTPDSLNRDIAEYVRDHAVSAYESYCKANGIAVTKAGKAKAFVTGYDFFSEVIKENEDAQIRATFGNSKQIQSELYQKGVWALEIPREDCGGQSQTFCLVLNSVGKDLGIEANPVMGFARGGPGEGTSTWVNHVVVRVVYTDSGKVEGYDPKHGRKIDSRDPDAAASWPIRFNGTNITGAGLIQGNNNLTNWRDPFSTLTREEARNIPMPLVETAKTILEQYGR